MGRGQGGGYLQPPGIHALKKALGVICRQPTGKGLAEVAEEAGAPLIAEATTTSGSLKAALDLDWDDPEERTLALVRVLEALDAVETYLISQGSTREEEGKATEQSSPPQSGIELARRVREQDVVEEENGTSPALRRGVARERLVSVEDPQMRHGRKSSREQPDRDREGGVARVRQRVAPLTQPVLPCSLLTLLTVLLVDFDLHSRNVPSSVLAQALFCLTSVEERVSDQKG